MAAQSASVKVTEPPAPELMPEVLTAEGQIIMTLVPMLEMELLIDFAAPAPISIMVITTPTPMTMPNIVSSERKTLRRRETKAARICRSKFI
jgi:hypothetical protein